MQWDSGRGVCGDRSVAQQYEQCAVLNVAFDILSANGTKVDQPGCDICLKMRQRQIGRVCSAFSQRADRDGCDGLRNRGRVSDPTDACFPRFLTRITDHMTSNHRLIVCLVVLPEILWSCNNFYNFIAVTFPLEPTGKKWT